MSDVASLIRELRRQNIVVWLEGDQLRCKASAGALKPELRELIALRRNDIVEFLHSAETAARQQRAIVPLQQNGSRIPIFAVPGHNGDVFCYRALAQALGDEQPFLGLQPPGLDGASSPLTSVEGLAVYFGQQIRDYLPEGPYRIIGFCGGGAVAFELARQQQRCGAAVDAVTLFGSPHPAFFRFAAQVRFRVANRLKRMAEHVHELSVRSLPESKRYLSRVAAERRMRKDADQLALNDPIMRMRASVEAATVAALRVYRPGKFAGRLNLILPSEPWARAGLGALDWRSHGEHPAVYFGPDGCDGDNMLRGPNAATFARIYLRSQERSV